MNSFYIRANYSRDQILETIRCLRNDDSDLSRHLRDQCELALVNNTLTEDEIQNC